MSGSIGTRDNQRLAQSAAANEDGNLSRQNASELMGSVVGTLAFTAGDTITDSGNGFVNRGVAVGDVVRIGGSPLNSRDYVVQTVAAGSITVLPAIVQDEANNSVAYIRRVS